MLIENRYKKSKKKKNHTQWTAITLRKYHLNRIRLSIQPTHLYRIQSKHLLRNNKLPIIFFSNPKKTSKLQLIIPLNLKSLIFLSDWIFENSLESWDDDEMKAIDHKRDVLVTCEKVTLIEFFSPFISSLYELSSDVGVCALTSVPARIFFFAPFVHISNWVFLRHMCDSIESIARKMAHSFHTYSDETN